MDNRINYYSLFIVCIHLQLSILASKIPQPINFQSSLIHSIAVSGSNLFL